MDINKVNKAVSILEDSNRLLKGRMDELRHALKKEYPSEGCRRPLLRARTL